MHMRYIKSYAIALWTLPPLIAIAFASSSPFASAQPKRAVKLASTHVFTYAPLLLAKELGYFSSEGLDVELMETQSTTATAAALLGGSVDAGGAGFNQPLLLAAQGKGVKTLVGMEMSCNYVFVVTPKIKVVDDDPKALAVALKGKRIGVASMGSPGHLIAEGLLSEEGVKNSEATYVAIGTGAAALAALKAGAVDAAITYEPDLGEIQRSGAARIALDLRRTRNEAVFSKLPTSSLQATSAWIDKNPDIAAKLVRAIDHANKTLQEDPKQSLAALEKLYPTMTPDSLKAMYDASRTHFRSAVTPEQYSQAAAAYLKMGLIEKDVPYKDAVASSLSSLWH